MKKATLLCLFTVAAISSKAQTPKLFVTDSSIAKPQQLLFPNRIIAKTDKGIVYALPQDNMPVFVPDSSVVNNMPNALKESTTSSFMPNPYYPGKPKTNPAPITTDSSGKQVPFKLHQYKQKPVIIKKIERTHN
ncbi:hypothetical protein ESA94_07005 [Lacibacter luteus]|uniref:Uncharacterized protein n=1 Tax=Lacibacter luteus TaxID=2508719 RepID=A0A4Q1CPZ6_9BACT|nr:hypothetical protein [Lacibacter luteus]RXK62739.1 hypothetical protein ESA94_07005 [Lacibacter luteus]